MRIKRESPLSFIFPVSENISKQTGLNTSSKLLANTQIEALSQFSTAKASHLRTGVSLAASQFPCVLAFEYSFLGKVGQYAIHRQFLVMTLHIVIDHKHNATGTKDAAELKYEDSHLEKVLFNRDQDILLGAQLVFLPRRMSSTSWIAPCSSNNSQQTVYISRHKSSPIRMNEQSWTKTLRLCFTPLYG